LFDNLLVCECARLDREIEIWLLFSRCNGCCHNLFFFLFPGPILLSTYFFPFLSFGLPPNPLPANLRELLGLGLLLESTLLHVRYVRRRRLSISYMAGANPPFLLVQGQGFVAQRRNAPGFIPGSPRILCVVSFFFLFLQWVEMLYGFSLGVG
jgi:hypothetical protein